MWSFLTVNTEWNAFLLLNYFDSYLYFGSGENKSWPENLQHGGSEKKLPLHKRLKSNKESQTWNNLNILTLGSLHSLFILRSVILLLTNNFSKVNTGNSMTISSSLFTFIKDDVSIPLIISVSRDSVEHNQI